MIVFYTRETETKAIVNVINYELKEIPEGVTDAVKVNSVPTPEDVVGKRPVPYVDLTTSQVYFEYVDRPLKPEEEIQQLKAENEQLKADNLTALEAIAELYEMILTPQA
ncbi:MAG TPA: hypothetical protein VD757_02610 [Candidatus Nitrosocosmicus sp.]|nr:hypothetical protein [Candidatus Nitrosocosmicus sp.]